MSVGEVSNWDLLDAARAGDRAAYGKLWSRCRGDVYVFVLCRVRDPQLAEDIVSEAFTRGLARIDSVTYRGRSDVAAWFVTIARNIVLDHVKSARYRLDVPCGEFTDADRGMVPVSQAVEDADRAVTLAGYVRRLTVDQAEVIRLRFYAGLGVAEAAKAMGRSTEALKALQHRACRRLAVLVDVEAV